MSCSRASANTGVPPAQWAACAVAEKVKPGITTGRPPPTPAAWSTSISPAVQLETATTYGTSSSLAALSSSSATVGPFVSCPLSSTAPSRSSSAARSGTRTRVSGRPAGNAGGPPSAAGRAWGSGVLVMGWIPPGR